MDSSVRTKIKINKLIVTWFSNLVSSTVTDSVTKLKTILHIIPIVSGVPTKIMYAFIVYI